MRRLDTSIEPISSSPSDALLLADDSVIHAVAIDADYVPESILKPQSAIVKGYEAVPMADFSAVLTKEQVEGLMEYLRELE